MSWVAGTFELTCFEGKVDYTDLGINCNEKMGYIRLVEVRFMIHLKHHRIQSLSSLIVNCTRDAALLRNKSLGHKRTVSKSS